MTTRFDRYDETYGDQIQRSIGFIGQDHDFFIRAKVHHLLNLTQRHVGPPGKLSILDVGCGIGLTDRFLTEAFASVHGTDISERSLKKAATINSAVTYTAQIDEQLPFEEATFDVTFAIGVLHHVPPGARPNFVRQMARVTRAGGLVVIFEHNPLNPLTVKAVDRCDFDDDAILVHESKTLRLLRQAPLDVVSAYYFLFFPWAFPGRNAIERSLRRVPLGAQYVVAARRR